MENETKKENETATIAEAEAKATEKERKLKEFRERHRHRVRSFFKDFKAFISKGNIMNLAVAVVIGAAFTAIVNSLVGDIIMPLLSLVLGRDGLAEMVSPLPNGETIKWGVFLQSIITFFLVAFCVFLILRTLIKAGKGINKLSKAQKARLKELKKHPELAESIPEEIVEAAAPVNTETAEDILRDIRELLKLQRTGEERLNNE